MRILVLYMYYLRPGDPGIRRFNEFCRLWADEPGVEVTVVTGQIHHNTQKVYPDIEGRPVVREHDGKVEVIRLAGPATYHAGFKGRAYSQIGWSRAVQRLLPTLSRPDVVLGSSPPLFVAQPTIAAKRRFKAPAIIEVRDMWPEAITQLRVASPHHPGVLYLGALERWSYRHANHVVTLVETQRNSIVQRRLKSAADISVITNGVLLEDFEAVAPDARGRIRGQLGIRDDETLVMYVGSHGPLHNIVKLVELAAALQHRPDIRLVSVGDGPERAELERLTHEHGLTNLRFVGSVPAHEIPAYLSAADIGCSLVNTTAGTRWDSHTRGIFRNAFFDLAGARLPLVFNVPGYTRDELEGRAQAGYYSDTNAGLDDMAAHVIRLTDDPDLRRQLGENNYREIAVRYNRRRMAAGYLELMRRLTG